MPTEIFEDALDLSIGLLATEPIARGPSYPFPRLQLTGERAVRTFRTIVIENPFLRVAIVPALGGRILSLFDKRLGREILPVESGGETRVIEPVAGGRRGTSVLDGIQLRLDGEDRLNSLGDVAFQIEEAMDDETPAGVWLAETSTANGLAFHLYVSLRPDRAEVRFEARIHNRTFRPIAYDGELAVAFGAGEFVAGAVYDRSRDVGLAFSSDSPFDGMRFEDGILRFARFGRVRTLAPRQVDTWSATLHPFSGLGGLDGWSREVAAALADDAVRIQSATHRSAHKLVLLTVEGTILEAPIDLYPEHVLETSLRGLPSHPVAIAILDPAHREILRIEEARSIERAPLPPDAGAGAEWPSVDMPTDTLRRMSFDVARRSISHTILGVQALGIADFGRADAEFEQALLYNGEDSLLWWEKAVARRLAAGSEDAEEGPELLNAHFLAPLEPALKAEAFFSQPTDPLERKNSLVATLADRPEEFVEVACLLIEHGRLDLAGRWIGEALNHADLAMLHLLLAYCLLAGTKMDAEAADRLGMAKRVAGPPYPWRDIERTALMTLHARFPDDAHVSELLALLSV